MNTFSTDITISSTLYERLERKAAELSQERQFQHSADMVACELLAKALLSPAAPEVPEATSSVALPASAPTEGEGQFAKKLAGLL